MQFRPWMRAVLEAETGQSDILFPEYFIEPEAPFRYSPWHITPGALGAFKPDTGWTGGPPCAGATL